MLTTSTPRLGELRAERRWPLWAILFAAFTCPISVEGFSVNYSFLLCPLAAIIANGRVKKLSGGLLLALAYYVLVFIFASLLQWDWVDLWGRRLVSFLVFMSVFAFVFIRVGRQMTEGFKAGVVLVSSFLALDQIRRFVLLSSEGPLHFEAKGLVGSQRLGFLYLIAIWVVLLWTPQGWTRRIVKYSCLTALGLGSSLTFSRATVVALVGSLMLFASWSLSQEFTRPTGKELRKLAGVVVVLVIVAGAVYSFSPVTVEFYLVRLLSAFTTGVIAENIGDPVTSEGARIFIWETVGEFVLGQPLTGTGYLGVWAILGEDIAGSSHSQYIDVLLRTGIAGLFIYCWLLWKIARYLYREERGLFWGFCGFVLYGLFHETAKESQGAAILAFLLGMARSGGAFSNRQVRGASGFSVGDHNVLWLRSWR